MGSFDRSDLKERNRQTVYALFATKRSFSKADVARQTGISGPTVLKIVEYFEKINLLIPVDAAERNHLSPGRRPHPLKLNPDAAYAIGLEYNGVHAAAGLVDPLGNLRFLLRRPVTENLKIFINSHLEKLVHELLGNIQIPREKIVGMGIGLPGAVDPQTRIIKFAPLVGVPEALDLSESLLQIEKNLRFPVVVENDANASALGEYAQRFPGQEKDLLFSALGRGLGAGIILEGKLRRGPHFFAGEIGYLVFHPQWKANLNKPGWLESRADLTSFWTEVATYGNPSQESLKRVADYISVCLSNLCVSLDIEQIILGGFQGTPFQTTLLEMIQERLRRVSVLPISCHMPTAREPGVIGAGLLAVERWLHEVFTGP